MVQVAAASRRDESRWLQTRGKNISDVRRQEERAETEKTKEQIPKKKNNQSTHTEIMLYV